MIYQEYYGEHRLKQLASGRHGSSAPPTPARRHLQRADVAAKYRSPRVHAVRRGVTCRVAATTSGCGMRLSPHMRMVKRFLYIGLVVAVIVPSVVQPQAALTSYQSLGRDLLKELVETNTTYSAGSTTKAAEAMAARFRA